MKNISFAIHLVSSQSLKFILMYLLPLRESCSVLRYFAKRTASFIERLKKVYEHSKKLFMRTGESYSVSRSLFSLLLLVNYTTGGELNAYWYTLRYYKSSKTFTPVFPM